MKSVDTTPRFYVKNCPILCRLILFRSCLILLLFIADDEIDGVFTANAIISIQFCWLWFKRADNKVKCIWYGFAKKKEKNRSTVAIIKQTNNSFDTWLPIKCDYDRIKEMSCLILSLKSRFFCFVRALQRKEKLKG